MLRDVKERHTGIYKCHGTGVNSTGRFYFVAQSELLVGGNSSGSSGIKNVWHYKTNILV